MGAVVRHPKTTENNLPSTLSGWCFGTFSIFPYAGNVIIPTDELHDFSEGLAATTNQLSAVSEVEKLDAGPR